MTSYQFLKKGNRHIRTGEVCQDHAKHMVLPNGDVAFALSDGAGSATYAKDGAICNVEGALEFLQEQGQEKLFDMEDAEIREHLLESCRQRIQAVAEELGCSDLRQFSATLLCGIISETGYVCMHIGDGAIYGSTKEQVFFNSEPENGARSNITFFTVSHDAEAHLRIDKNKDVPDEKLMYVATTDGFYATLENRGYGNPEESVLEMAGVVLKELIHDNNDLLELALEMSELEEEKTDDWSMIVITNVL